MCSDSCLWCNAVLQRLYRQRFRRRIPSRSHSKPPLLVEDSHSEAWSRFCSKVLESWYKSPDRCPIIARPWLHGTGIALKCLLAFSMLPFIAPELLKIVSEWLKVWIAIDREAKVNMLSNGITASCSTALNIIDKIRDSVHTFIAKTVTTIVCAVWTCVRFIVVTVLGVIKITVGAFCSVGIFLAKAIKTFFSFLSKTVLTGLGGVANAVNVGLDKIGRVIIATVQLLGQGFISTAAFGQRLFAKLLPEKRQWHPKEAELLAQIKEETHTKKGKNKKGPKSKQPQQSKQRQQQHTLVSAEAKSHQIIKTTNASGAKAAVRPGTPPTPAGGPSRGASESATKLPDSLDALSDPVTHAPSDVNDAASAIQANMDTPIKVNGGLPLKPAASATPAIVRTQSGGDDGGAAKPVKSEAPFQAVVRASSKANAKVAPKPSAVPLSTVKTVASLPLKSAPADVKVIAAAQAAGPPPAVPQSMNPLPADARPSGHQAAVTQSMGHLPAVPPPDGQLPAKPRPRGHQPTARKHRQLPPPSQSKSQASSQNAQEQLSVEAPSQLQGD